MQETDNCFKNSYKISDVWMFYWDLFRVQNFVKIRQKCNDVSNQQDATAFSFINFLKSAPHVSGDKFAHPQEHFLTVYTAFGTMHRHCRQPVHCTKSCTYSQKVLLRIGEFVVRNMWGRFKNKINKRKSCCILLVAYIVVLLCTVKQTSNSDRNSWQFAITLRLA